MRKNQSISSKLKEQKVVLQIQPTIEHVYMI